MVLVLCVNIVGQSVKPSVSFFKIVNSKSDAVLSPGCRPHRGPALSFQKVSYIAGPKPLYNDELDRAAARPRSGNSLGRISQHGNKK